MNDTVDTDLSFWIDTDLRGNKNDTVDTESELCIDTASESVKFIHTYE